MSGLAQAVEEDYVTQARAQMKDVNQTSMVIPVTYHFEADFTFSARDYRDAFGKLEEHFRFLKEKEDRLPEFEGSLELSVVEV